MDCGSTVQNSVDQSVLVKIVFSDWSKSIGSENRIHI